MGCCAFPFERNAESRSRLSGLACRPCEVKGGAEGGRTNEPDEYHVGAVRFHKLAPDLFICHSVFRFDGTIGGSRVLYLFEVYERDIWSIDYSDAPVRSKLVRYIGAMPIDEVPKFREEWLRRRETESHKDE